jgi:hypothetical protein
MRIFLEGNPLGVLGARHLARARFENLTTLNLDDTVIGPEGACAIAEADLPELRRLHAGSNAIGDEGALALTRSDLLERLELLDLSENEIGARGTEALKARATSLELRLAHNPGA